jgi:hypothetical protein
MASVKSDKVSTNVQSDEEEALIGNKLAEEEFYKHVALKIAKPPVSPDPDADWDNQPDHPFYDPRAGA